MEKREFRLYTNATGDEAVKKDIYGEQSLRLALAETRKKFPDAMVVVREVLETVIEIHPPKSTE